MLIAVFYVILGHFYCMLRKWKRKVSFSLSLFGLCVQKFHLNINRSDYMIHAEEVQLPALLLPCFPDFPAALHQLAVGNMA